MYQQEASVQEQLKTQASEVLCTRELLQLLSKKKLPAHGLRGLEADLALRNPVPPHSPSDGIVMREADFKRLVGEGFISGHATQDKTRERVELERDLATQRARLSEAQASAAETEQAKTAYRFETQRQLNDRHAQAVTKRIQLSADASKATQRERQTQLTVPVAGVIQQLAIHTVGGVVTSAQPLMIVVPDSPTVTAEITIANQDIGFVYAGQMAEVKLETFPYTKYGTVAARVDVVTADAVTDEKKGSYYPATLTLSQRDMLIDGKRVNLSPGMNITAEIKTGQRRIIEFLLSPV